MRIIAFDPGGTTGWACYTDEIGCKRFYGSGEYGPHPHHVELHNLLEVQQPDVVVCERFDYVGGKVTVDLMAPQYIGVMELWVRMNGAMSLSPSRVPLVMQSRSLKDFWDNGKLKALDLYRPQSQMPHANDAMRHLLVYLCAQADDLWFMRYLQVHLGHLKTE